MKRISYQFRSPAGEEGAFELLGKSIECQDADLVANYAIAQSEAAGEITVEDIPDPPPTAEERLEAQVVYTAMMTDTMLEE